MKSDLFTIIKHSEQLTPMMPLRIILRKEDNNLAGLCEDSFSMSTVRGKARIWWSGKAYSMLGEHTIDGVKDAEHNAKEGDIIYDPLSEECPVTIDWDKWLNATTKYEKRNASFTTKGN